MKKTLLQLGILVGGVLGFALLLDQVINLADDIPPGAVVAADQAAESARVAVTEVAENPISVAPVMAVAQPQTTPEILPGPLATNNPDDARALLALSRDSWAMVRSFEGLDYLYFASVVAYRCGLKSLRYGVNGANAATVLSMEPCHSGTPEPNAMIEMDRFPPFLTFPPGTVQSVAVELTYLDGTIDLMTYDRSQILRP